MSTVAAGKLWRLLTSAQRRSLLLLLGPMFIGMAMEAMSIGLIVPLIALLTHPDYAQRYPALQPVLAALGHVAEGVYSAPVVLARARALGVEMPITEAVVAVLEGRTSPREAMQALMGREARAES